MDWEDDQDASESEFGSVSEPDPATEALYDRLLTDVFGPAIATSPLHPALRDTLAHLDQLRQAVPALRGGPLDLDAVTRQVLLLDTAHPVTDAQRGELFRVAMAPETESAGSLAALAAFHLELRGVLSSTQALTGDDGAWGRNWTTATIPDLDLTEVGKVARQPDGTLGRGDVRPAPWHRPGEPKPYVVMAEGDHRRIVVRGHDGAPRQVRSTCSPNCWPATPGSRRCPRAPPWCCSSPTPAPAAWTSRARRRTGSAGRSGRPTAP
ncbi:hypothetical protein GCM10023238_14580 [Streptomyces heliomycini]